MRGIKNVVLALIVVMVTGCGYFGFKSTFQNTEIPSHLELTKLDFETYKAHLIAPKNQKALGALMIFTGSSGGIMAAERVAIEFANQGYASMAIGYFGMDNIRSELANIDILEFKKAGKWLKSAYPEMTSIGLIGISRGSELVMLLAANDQAFGPVIAISPSNVLWGSAGSDTNSPAWRIDETVPSFVHRTAEDKIENDTYHGATQFERDWLIDQRQSEIAVEQINRGVLLLSGQDDQLWPAAQMAERAAHRLADKNYPYPYQHLTFVNAGHVFTPGMPNNLLTVTTPAGVKILLGGTQSGNQKAQAKAMKAMLSFLETTLN